jgi:hypothetical protein
MYTTHLDVENCFQAHCDLPVASRILLQTPDGFNPLFYLPNAAVNTIIVVHPFMIDDATPGDSRVTRKFFKRNIPVVVTTDATPLSALYQDARWTTNTAPITFIRNEELILLKAEAHANLGQTTEAVNAINVIRKSAALADYTGATTKDALINEILYQRRYSLWAEPWGHRWIDARRYNKLNEIPTSDDDFEYSLCTNVLQHGWANFDLGTMVAKSIKKGKALGMPNSFLSAINHAESEAFLVAFKLELESWIRLKGMLPNSGTIDWKNIDPLLIGDLMLIFDKKFNPDGSFLKYKCRIVFRGDRWKNINNLPKYATAVDTDSLLLFLGIAASEDLDLWKVDVGTAFLHGEFPPGMVQYVRRPHGVPDEYMPRMFQLGKCVYGHPLASYQWDIKANKDLASLDFKKLSSSPSVMIREKSKTSDRIALARATDDILFQAPYGSANKSEINSALEKIYGKITIEDTPSGTLNYLGMQFTRNRKERTIDILMPKFMDEMRIKYPMNNGKEYPTTPQQYSKYFSKQELLDKEILLTKSQILEFQGVLGDSLWIAMHIKPTVKFALNLLSRRTANKPTLYDFNQALRVMHYCIGTADVPRKIGGKYGSILTVTVDSSFASHEDLKGQSCYTIHMGGGGSVMMDSKKQDDTAYHSTESEILGTALADKNVRWARNFTEEMGYPQREATPVGEDNTSTMKILNETSSIGKTKYMNLKFNIIKESIARKIYKLFYLETEDMPADIGTKALAPGIFKKLSDFCLGVKPLPQFLPFLTSKVDLPTSQVKGVS